MQWTLSKVASVLVCQDKLCLKHLPDQDIMQDWLAMAVESKHFVCVLVAASLLFLPSNAGMFLCVVSVCGKYNLASELV